MSLALSVLPSLQSPVLHCEGHFLRLPQPSLLQCRQRPKAAWPQGDLKTFLMDRPGPATWQNLIERKKIQVCRKTRLNSTNVPWTNFVKRTVIAIPENWENLESEKTEGRVYPPLRVHRLVSKCSRQIQKVMLNSLQGSASKNLQSQRMYPDDGLHWTKDQKGS